MSKITAIVSLYNPGSENIKNVFDISLQADRVVVCDNSPVDNGDSFAGNDKIIYVSELRNKGLPGAFNAVLKDDCFGWTEDEYVIFFDQDSIINSDHIKKLIDEFENLSSHGLKIGCVGPVFYNRALQKKKLPRAYKRLNENSIAVKGVITSSMVCRYDVLAEVGFWNEELFLDMVDWDLCWRLMREGYLCVTTDVSVMSHAVGEGVKRVGPIKLRIAVPVREYYQTRDSITLLFGKYTPLKYRIRFIENLTVRAVLRLLFLDNRRLRLKYMLRGVKDNFKGIHGEYKE